MPIDPCGSMPLDPLSTTYHSVPLEALTGHRSARPHTDSTDRQEASFSPHEQVVSVGIAVDPESVSESRCNITRCQGCRAGPRERAAFGQPELRVDLHLESPPPLLWMPDTCTYDCCALADEVAGRSVQHGKVDDGAGHEFRAVRAVVPAD